MSNHKSKPQQPHLYQDYIESNFEEYKEYQRKALNQEPEMTKWLKKLLPCWLDVARAYKVLDIGCGNGNTCFHLNRQYANWEYFGIDVVPRLIEDGKRLFANISNLQLEVADAHDLSLDEQFDIVLLWRVLQGLKDWKEAMKQAYNVTKPGGHLVVSTLLNDSDVDILVKMRDHDASGEVKDVPLRIFSETQFRNYCEINLGAATIEIQKFTMPITLPKPDHGLNTYTVDLLDGTKLQLAGGALVDHWKVAHICKS